MRSPVTHVSISEPTDPSSQCLLFDTLSTHDNVVIHSPHPYTVQQNLPGLSHNVTVFSSETGTKGSCCAMMN